jgi:hypothetical protein
MSAKEKIPVFAYLRTSSAANVGVESTLVGCTEAQIATITGHSCATCARSSTPTTCTAIRRSARARAGSSKGGGEIE